MLLSTLHAQSSKSTLRNQFTAENAKGAEPPRAGLDRSWKTTVPGETRCLPLNFRPACARLAVRAGVPAVTSSPTACPACPRCPSSSSQGWFEYGLAGNSSTVGNRYQLCSIKCPNLLEACLEQEEPVVQPPQRLGSSAQ